MRQIGKYEFKCQYNEEASIGWIIITMIFNDTNHFKFNTLPHQRLSNNTKNVMKCLVTNKQKKTNTYFNIDSMDTKKANGDVPFHVSG